MNRPSLLLFILAILVVSFVVTGFQCGSTDVTSAKLYIQRNDYASAEKSLLKETQKNPNNGEAWYLLGFCQLQNRKFDDMLTSFDQCLKTPTASEYQERVQQGRLSAWGQLFNEGLGYHNLMVKASPDSVKLLGQKAIDRYLASARCVADSPATYQNLAAVTAIMKDYDNEIIYLKKVNALSKTSTSQRDIINAYLQKADALNAANKNDEAMTTYKEALANLNEARKTSPDDNDLLQLTIDIYIQIGQAKDALPLMQEAVQKDPTNKSLQNNLGILLMQSDDLKGAIEHFNAAVAADSLFLDALRNLGVSYLRLGDQMRQEAQAKVDPKKKDQEIDKAYLEPFKLACKTLEHLVTVKHDNPDFWDAMATAYANVNNSKQAQKAIIISDAIRNNNLAMGMAEGDLPKTFGKPDKNTPSQINGETATMLTYTTKGVNIFIADGKVAGWGMTK